jgi:hypothetical protein
MSCDWDVYCLDCEAAHGFYDANHENELMRNLAKGGAAMKAAASAMLSIQRRPYDLNLFEVKCSGYNVDLEWWAAHGEHKLCARDEYGAIDGQCYEMVTTCAKCKTRERCRLQTGHDGACAAEPD